MEKNPTEDEVVQFVLGIKKSEPELGIARLHARIKSDEPTWALSVNRLRSILRSHSLTNTSLTATSNDSGMAIADEFRDRLYISQTVSSPVSNLTLPTGIEVFTSRSRGKGLQVSSTLPESIPEGAMLWTEPALVLIPPISLVGLIPTGKACSYCSRPLVSMSSLIASCSTCSGRWCSSRCRKLDKIHKYIRHGKYTSEWIAIEQFAVENEWSAFYQYAYTLAASIFDDQDEGQFSKHFVRDGVAGLAKIRQDIRQKADPQHGKAMFMGEQLEMMWEAGYKVLCKFFSHLSAPSYEEYLSGIGMVNINNLDGSIYLLQSHLNHSCEPSVDVKIVGRTAGVKVTAKRQLYPGEELTTTYVDLKKDVMFRRQKLLEGWGFWCTCPRCMREQDGTLEDGQRENKSPSSKDNVGRNTIADADSPKKKKKGKSKSKKPTSEPARVRKKSVTFDDNVVQIEI
ncbi:hypothetical protein POJ06DRAFT_101439 [Lipomyces tetrasporus]|uniref:Histone-lysine N-methyltransferase SET5 n=1 Tax=Lipomyces tetrasporus TaxID=54092 RepID=A0AAD7QRW4_9ASCO|nr:uncharacterized protein POJ06DRAFT_101439 [Lipomyces tetrasporus]KAJ8100310.1 hypothetical protein POJ06DRAFT_101439 [Lipomyces tetrasporus]